MHKRFGFLCLLALLAPPALAAQIPEAEATVGEVLDLDALGRESVSEAPVPSVDSIGSRFVDLFKGEAAQRDFRRLREFRSKRQSALDAARQREPELQNARERLESSIRSRASVGRALQGALSGTSGDSVFVKTSLPVEYDEVLGSFTPGQATREAVIDLRASIMAEDSVARQNLAKLDSAAARLAQNVSDLEEDIRQAEAAIDVALAPEYQSQAFRKDISKFFAGVIAVMILAFFATIYMRGGTSVGSLLLSDGGLQFVTIFVLIIAIILFGILNILAGRELAAILSGIAGYILGRGAQSATAAAPPANAPQPQPQPAVPPAEPQMVRVPGLYIPPADVLPPDPPQPGPQGPVAPAPASAPAAAQAPPAAEAAGEGNAPAEKPEPVAVG
jgi:hypothetical protein